MLKCDPGQAPIAALVARNYAVRTEDENLMSKVQGDEIEGGQVESIKDELLGAGDVVLVEVGSVGLPMMICHTSCCCFCDVKSKL